MAASRKTAAKDISLPAKIFKEMRRNFSRFMTKLGIHVIHILSHVGLIFRDAAKEMFRRIINKLGEKSTFRSRVIETKKKIKDTKRRTEDFFFWLREDFEETLANKNLLCAVGVGAKHILSGLWRIRGVFVRAFNWALPAVCIVFMVSVVSAVSNLAYGVSVECNGKMLGVLGTESEYDVAEKVLQDRITYVEGNEKITITPKLSVQLITSQAQIVNSDELVNKLLVSSDADLTQASGIYIDGEFYGAVKDGQTIESLLSRMLSKYKGEGVKEVFFDKDVRIENGLYLTDSIVDSSEIIGKLSGYKTVPAYYTVQKGDTPSEIAEGFSLTTAELTTLNPQIAKNMLPGDELLVNVAEPFLSVNVVKEIEYIENIPYETIKTETNNLYQGDKKTVKKGIYGEKRVLADVVLKDGIEVSRTILETEVLSAPVAAEVNIGTKPLAPIKGTYISGTGEYSWPVAGGYISAYMGDGRGHKGVDIAAPYGTTIFAADEGTVISVQSITYGYGKNIRIQHADGTITHYAHCSAMYVSVGQHVIKGEPIAAVGSTGDSTGNHCHFEVIVNGSFKNPMDYIT